MDTIRGTTQEVRIESASITISDRSGKSYSIQLDDIATVKVEHAFGVVKR